MDFLDLLPTLMSCNFFSTEPILKISDVFSRWESNSFISAVLVAQSKIGVPSHAYLWAGISEISKIRMCTTPPGIRRLLSPNGGCYPQTSAVIALKTLEFKSNDQGLFKTSKIIEIDPIGAENELFKF